MIVSTEPGINLFTSFNLILEPAEQQEGHAFEQIKLLALFIKAKAKLRTKGKRALFVEFSVYHFSVIIFYRKSPRANRSKKFPLPEESPSDDRPPPSNPPRRNPPPPEEYPPPEPNDPPELSLQDGLLSYKRSAASESMPCSRSLFIGPSSMSGVKDGREEGPRSIQWHDGQGVVVHIALDDLPHGRRKSVDQIVEALRPEARELPDEFFRPVAREEDLPRVEEVRARREARPFVRRHVDALDLVVVDAVAFQLVYRRLLELVVSMSISVWPRSASVR